MGSLAGAAHLLQDNAGVQGCAQRDEKSHVEHKGKSTSDCVMQDMTQVRKKGLTIPTLVCAPH